MMTLTTLSYQYEINGTEDIKPKLDMSLMHALIQLKIIILKPSSVQLSSSLYIFNKPLSASVSLKWSVIIAGTFILTNGNTLGHRFCVKCTTAVLLMECQNKKYENWYCVYAYPSNTMFVIVGSSLFRDFHTVYTL
jgi:hypothetical protein